MAAAFQLPCMRFPKSCAAVEELGRQEQERQRGRQKQLWQQNITLANEFWQIGITYMCIDSI